MTDMDMPSADEIHESWLRSQGVTLVEPQPMTDERRATLTAEAERMIADAKREIARLTNPAPLGAGHGQT